MRKVKVRLAGPFKTLKKESEIPRRTKSIILAEPDGQFVWSMYGQSRLDIPEENTRVYHLMEAGKRGLVGFLGLVVAPEDLGSHIQITAHVPFVYINISHRGHGLSKLYHDLILQKLKRRYKRLRSQYPQAKPIHLAHISTDVSDAGEKFLLTLEKRIKRHCERKGIVHSLPLLDFD